MKEDQQKRKTVSGKGIILTIPNELGKVILLYQAAFSKRYPSLKRPTKQDAAIEMMYLGKQGLLNKMDKLIKQYQDYNS